MYPYTAKRRDVLENTLPEAQEISQGRGFCTPRPERLPEGNLEGRGVQNPRTREISRAEGVYFPMHPDSRQCTDILSELAGKYWFCGVTTDGSSISIKGFDLPIRSQWREIHSTYMHSVLVYIFYHRNSFLPNNAASVSFLDILPGNNRWRCHQSEFQFSSFAKNHLI